MATKNNLLSFDERECEWKGRFSDTNLTSESSNFSGLNAPVVIRAISRQKIKVKEKRLITSW